ncbi:MAG: RluA family pseudouridine synthase [Burkholderiaceae bacterium]
MQAPVDPHQTESSDEPLERIEIDARAGAGERVDRFLATQLTGVSRSRIQRWIDLGAVVCAERPLARDTRLSGAERLTVTPQQPDAERAFRPEPVPLSIVARGAEYLIIDKPAGLVVHPAPGNWGGTLMNGLLHLIPGSSRLPRAGIVHRLDKDTSGLMVVALTERSRLRLIEDLSEHRVSRRYVAIAAGRLMADRSVHEPIGRDPRHRQRLAVVAGGKAAHTDLHPLADGSFEGKPFTVVACRLHTGRTHQIRVHMASIGHPLLADPLYGGPCVDGLDRQALHAARLAFDDPCTGVPAGPFAAALPADLSDWLQGRGIDGDALTRAAFGP